MFTPTEEKGMTVTRLTLIFALSLLASFQSLNAEVLVWDFVSSENQIKNGPEPDGSTNSPGTGTGHIEYDTESNIISYTFTWDNLFGDLTKLHVHGPADENSSNPQHILEFLGPPAVPSELQTTSGTWSDSHLLETLIQPGFDPLSPEQIIEIMTNGQAYLNVHTSVFGMGEIRGNLGVPIPEPSGVLLLGTALLPFVSCSRRRS